MFTNVNSALYRARLSIPTCDFVGGLGGDDITADQVRGIYGTLERVAAGARVLPVTFLGVEDGSEVDR